MLKICLLGVYSSSWQVFSSPSFSRNVQHIGDFNFPRLADFGAAISGANKLQCQEVLEELDVSIIQHICMWLLILKNLILIWSNYETFSEESTFSRLFSFIGVCSLCNSEIFQVYKRLKLTLELVKKEIEITKIQVLMSLLHFRICV